MVFNVSDEDKHKFGIYGIRNLINGKTYIGQTGENFQRRFLHHNWKLHDNSHDNSFLQCAYNKYGDSSFEFVIIEIVTDSKMLDELEIKYIKEYKDKSLSYNMLDGGGGRRGFKMSESTKKLIGEKNRVHMTGKKHSDETKRKMSEARKDNTFFLNNNNTKLTEAIAKQVKELLVSGTAPRDIPLLTGVDYRHVNNMVSNNTWKHVYVEGWDEYRANRPTYKRKTKEEHKQIYDDYLTGQYTMRTLGEKYGISSSMVSIIIKKLK